MLVGTVVDYVSVEVSRRSEWGTYEQDFGGVVVAVEQELVDPSGYPLYEIFPVGVDSGCSRRGIKVADLSGWLRIGDEVLEGADRVRLEAWDMHGGYVTALPNETPDFDFHVFDFKRFREFARQQDLARQVGVYLRLGEFAKLVAINQLESMENDGDRIPVLERLIYGPILEQDYGKLVESNVHDPAAVTYLVQQYCELRSNWPLLQTAPGSGEMK